MKIFPVLVLFMIVMANCSKNKSAESLSNDNIPMADSLQSTAVEEEKQSEEGDFQYGYQVDSELVDASKIDTTNTLLITTSCIIETRETASQAATREEEDAREYAAAKEAALREWESQSHDSTEIFEYYPEFNDDAYYYQGTSSGIFSELNIPVIVVEEKEFVLLKKKNGESLLVNVRDGFISQWDIILFHVEKKPLRIDMMTVNKEQLQSYFFH